jgi:uncharacterized metal-binding protein YceD (DUF177 family)
MIVEQVPEAGTDVVIVANAGECTALAAWNGLAGISMLEAHFHVAHRAGRSLNVSGRVSASMTQICGVSLDPFESTIAQEVDVDFVPQEDLSKPKGIKSKYEAAKMRERAPLDEEEEDPPDLIVDGKIDLGSLASEFLALALDPYPRKPGAEFGEVLIDGTKDRESPFAILRRLDKTS